MPTTLTIEHIDTCLPCYLTDHHNREGECLIGVPVTGSTTVAEVYNALVDEALDADLPESVTEDMVRSACREAVDNNSGWQEPFDDSLEDDEPDGDGPQAWFVLRWTEGDPPAEVSDTDNVVRAVHGLIGDIPVGDEQAGDCRCPECGGALSDEIEPNGHDGSPTRFCTDCGLGWPADEGDPPEPASFDNKLVRDCSVHELTQALRERGCAVTVFSQDDAPDDYDFSGVEGGFAAWLVEKADHIEEQMRVRGSDALHDALVADDRVKLAGGEDA